MHTEGVEDGLAAPGRVSLVVAGLVALLPCASSAAEGPAYRLEAGDVRITVPLKPGGAFEAKTTSLGGRLTAVPAKPLALDGEVSVDLATIDTGIGLRNQHLREKYLEIAKGPSFEKAVLTQIHLRDAGDAGFVGRTAFSGTLLLHGTRREVAGTAEIRRHGAGARVEATFPLTLTAFGIEPPEYLGVGVADRVLVTVRCTAVPSPGGR
jgi:polyisoprenoid-binding protein YceI